MSIPTPRRTCYRSVLLMLKNPQEILENINTVAQFSHGCPLNDNAQSKIKI